MISKIFCKQDDENTYVKVLYLVKYILLRITYKKNNNKL